MQQLLSEFYINERLDGSGELFAIGRGGNSRQSAHCPGKMHLVRKTAFMRYGNDRHRGFGQKVSCTINSATYDELVQRQPGAVLEQSSEMVGTELEPGCNVG